MSGNPLLPSQKNYLFSVIQAAEMNPSEFEWVERPSRFGAIRGSGGGTVPVLLHSSSKFFFQFDRHPVQGHCVFFSPGEGKFEESEIAPEWYRIVGNFDKWLHCLKSELSQPDLWETIASEKRLITNVQPGGSDNTPFDKNELQRIDQSIRELKQYLTSTQNLNEQQMKIVNARLDYLIDAAPRMGRKDWVVLVTGVLANIAVSAALAPNTTHELFRFAAQVLNWLLGQRLLPPI